MSVRIHQLSKKVGTTNKELVKLLRGRGFMIKSASSQVDDISVQALIEEFSDPANRLKIESEIKSAQAKPPHITKIENMTIVPRVTSTTKASNDVDRTCDQLSQLSNDIGIPKRHLLRLLKARGFKVNSMNSTIDDTSAQALIEEFRKSPPTTKVKTPSLPVVPHQRDPLQQGKEDERMRKSKIAVLSEDERQICLIREDGTTFHVDFDAARQCMLNDDKAIMSRKEFRVKNGLGSAEGKRLYAAALKICNAKKQQSIPLATNNINPFSNIVARDWLANSLWQNEQPELDAPLILIGDGPFEALEFAQFLNRNELDCSLSGVQSSENPLDTVFWPYISSINPPIIVIGSENFRELELLSLLSDTLCGDSPITEGLLELPYWIEQLKTKGDHCYFHRSKSLKDITIVSQEMLLACLFSGSRPEDLSTPWDDHEKSHSILKTLSKRQIELNKTERFPWPSTVAADGDGSLEEEDWPDIGLLKYMGYTVGKNGEPQTIRRQILTSVFELTTIPKIDSPEYVKSWGTQRSASRLRKMAESIAAFARNNKRSSNTSLDAVGDWEDDLSWLEITHYRGKFNNKFTWPRTSN